MDYLVKFAFWLLTFFLTAATLTGAAIVAVAMLIIALIPVFKFMALMLFLYWLIQNV